MMKELGAILREAREGQGLSLEEVHDATHISLKYLAAIENGDFSSLPGEVYRRGFLRSFAEAVGVDPQEVLARYAELLAAEEARAGAEGHRDRDPQKTGDRRDKQGDGVQAWVRGAAGREGARPARTGLRLWAVIVVSVFVLAGAFEIARWDAINGDGAPQVAQTAPQPKPETPPEREAPASSGASKDERRGTGSGVPATFPTGADSAVIPENGSVADSRINMSLEQLPQQSAVQPPAAGSVKQTRVPIGPDAGSAASPSTASEAETVPASSAKSEIQTSEQGGDRLIRVNQKGAEGLVVTAEARQRCWFEVTADGKVVFSKTLEQGQSATWRASEELRVRVGNPPGARLAVNGVPVGDLGVRALTVVFQAGEQAQAGTAAQAGAGTQARAETQAGAETGAQTQERRKLSSPGVAPNSGAPTSSAPASARANEVTPKPGDTAIQKGSDTGSGDQGSQEVTEQVGAPDLVNE